MLNTIADSDHSRAPLGELRIVSKPVQKSLIAGLKRQRRRDNSSFQPDRVDSRFVLRGKSFHNPTQKLRRLPVRRVERARPSRRVHS
jgi:hypothetical protein